MRITDDQLNEPAVALDCGDGSDGDFVVRNPGTWFARPMQFRNVKVLPGASLVSGGCQIRIAGTLDLREADAAFIAGLLVQQ